MSTTPHDNWYALAPSDQVGAAPLGLRALDRPVVLFRTASGDAVALEDRCAHRPYPLSAGDVVADGIRCGLCGFVYAPTGDCVRVPTQPRVPRGAAVTAFPVREADGLVWAWLGSPGRAARHRVPELPWLTDPAWSTVGGAAEVAAGLLLLHESFADVTQIPFVAPEIAPAALGSEPPPLEVVVSETAVTLRREFPPAPLPGWQADLLDGATGDYPTVHEGYFVSPAVWVDHWDVTLSDGSARLRFSHLVTPVDRRRTRVLWRVSRDFAVGDAAADQVIADAFTLYYGRVWPAMETAQAVIDRDGPGPQVNTAADVAALRVREIVTALLAEETHRA